MAESWAQAYEDLHAGARTLLRGLAVLDLRTMSTASAPAAGGIAPRTVGARLAELVTDGWVAPGGDDNSWDIRDEPGRWLNRLARHVPASQAAAVVERFARYHLEVLTSYGSTSVRLDTLRGAEITAAVKAAGRHRLSTLAMELSLATWAVMAPTSERRWWRHLADTGENIAIEARDPDGLVELLHRSGSAFARAGDVTTADDQWRRAFALTQRLDAPDMTSQLLHLIGGLRRTNGSFGRALTAFFELVSHCAARDDQIGLTAALTDVGTTMFRAGRTSDAEYFLKRAGKSLPFAEDLPASVLPQYAATLMNLGRAWDEQGSPSTAMEYYSGALAHLVDVDPDSANKTRELLATAARSRSAERRRRSR